MIDQEHKESLIQASIMFMRTVTNIYGSEKGMELFNAIADTIDKDIKGDIFVALLRGEYDGKIRIKSYYPDHNRIAMIKALRSVDNRGLGLREAKELIDFLMDNRDRAFMR